MNSFGTAIRIEIFGESRGAAVGCVVDGLPAGFSPDLERIRFELSRRAPRRSAESTPRSEADDFQIVSGYRKDRLTGAPLCVLFPSRDADPDAPVPRAARPSHADLTASVKFRGFNDPRGGGMFSGRLTLPLLFAGALIGQILSEKGILITSHIFNIGEIFDEPFDACMKEVPSIDAMFPLINKELKQQIEALFHSVRTASDSVGCSVECAVLGVPAGIGEPFFDSIESMISHLVFSVPGVHAIEFGRGFGLCTMLGHEANDPILPGGSTLSNNSGGINGGISNGMPIIFRAGFRPVPSIGIAQASVDLTTGEHTVIKSTGRYDCCILPRGCAVIEACAAIAVYDLLRRYLYV